MHVAYTMYSNSNTINKHYCGEYGYNEMNNIPNFTEYSVGIEFFGFSMMPTEFNNLLYYTLQKKINEYPHRILPNIHSVPNFSNFQ